MPATPPRQPTGGTGQRTHYRRDGRGFPARKFGYRSFQEAHLAAQSNSDGLTSYLFDYCLLWHNGHASKQAENPLTSCQDALD